MSTESSTTSTTMRTQCQFFVVKKKRFCRMTVKQGEQYCGEHIDSDVLHQSKDGEESKQQRVVCPYDGKHTCYKSQLAKHMARCNSKPGILPAYILPGFNQGTCDSEPPKISLTEISDETLANIIIKIKHIYEAHVTINESIKEHPVLAAEIKKPELGAPALKHLVQNASLLAIMEDSGLLVDHSCFVEMGAGKGKLTYWLAQAVKDFEDCTFTLVDRASYRHKNENKLKGPEMNTHGISRVRADIGDLYLRNVSFLDSCQHVVAISKHLCGAATDLALRCVANSIEQKKDAKWNMQGLVMALCCHHRCDWKNYVGKEFFKEVELTSEDFAIMCVLVSWATCGSGRSRNAKDTTSNKKQKHSENYEDNPSNDIPNAGEPDEENKHKDRYVRLNLPQEVREEVGRKCKNIIDIGRKKYLESLGFKSNLLYYVPKNITLENVCVVATKNS